MTPPRPIHLSLLLGLAACAAPAEHAARPELAVALAEAWNAPASPGAVEGGAWWRALGAEELDGLVREALAHNHDLAASAARLRVAAASARAAGAGLRPSLDLSLGGARRRQNFIGFPIPGGGGSVLSTTSTVVDAGLAVAWEVDLWDRLGRGARAAAADEAAAAADLRGARESIAASTARAWLALREAQLQLELAERTQAAWSESQRVVQERYEAGLGSPLDLRLARSNSASAAAAAAAAERARDDARRALELVLGRYPAGELAPGGDLELDLGPAPAGLPVELLGRRPDLVAARLRLEAARQRAGAARADLWPRLTLTGNAGGSSQELDDLLDGDFSVWGLAARLAAPLLDGGRRRAAIEGADAATQEAAARLAAALLVAAGEVERALASEGHLRARVGHLSRARDEALAASELARDRYREGLTDVVTLLETQRRSLAAESQRLAAQRELLTGRVDLHLALGGGFAQEL